MIRQIMSDSQFSNCQSYDYSEIYEIRTDLENRGINEIKEKLDYVKNNYYGQLYLAYALEEIANVINNSSPTNDKFELSSSSIDGIIRAFFFAIKYMQENLPKHAYNYMINNSIIQAH